MREPRNLNEFPLYPGEFPVEGDWDTSVLRETYVESDYSNGKWGIQSFTLMESEMTTQKPGLVELIQTELKTFRASATVQGEPDFRELAVSLVRVFRDFVEAEIKMPDSYDKEEPGKGQGWE